MYSVEQQNYDSKLPPVGKPKTRRLSVLVKFSLRFREQLQIVEPWLNRSLILTYFGDWNPIFAMKARLLAKWLCHKFWSWHYHSVAERCEGSHTVA